MAGNTYKVIELVGTSEVGVTEAIQSAVSRAAETLRGLDWLEVQQIRGQIVDGQVAWFQVQMKIGFRVMDKSELEA